MWGMFMFIPSLEDHVAFWGFLRCAYEGIGLERFWEDSMTLFYCLSPRFCDELDSVWLKASSFGGAFRQISAGENGAQKRAGTQSQGSWMIVASFSPQISIYSSWGSQLKDSAGKSHASLYQHHPNVRVVQKDPPFQRFFPSNKHPTW